jgi:F-type H+-transporting ATPase subunit c
MKPQIIRIIIIKKKENSMEQSVIYIGAGLLFGLGAIGSAVGLGVLGSKFIESIARQPELRPFLLTNFFYCISSC